MSILLHILFCVIIFAVGHCLGFMAALPTEDLP